MLDAPVLRLLAEVVFLGSLFAAGYRLPTWLVERRLGRSIRLGGSLPAAVRRARRWRWVTGAAAVLLGLVFIGLTG